MEEKNLYQEFLVNQEMIESIKGEKLENKKVCNGLMDYEINSEILNQIIDSMVMQGSISDDEVTKNIYKNSYLFARKVAQQDYYTGSRGFFYNQIMEEIFNHAKDSIDSLYPYVASKSLSDSLRLEYFECSNLRNYQQQLLDCFGLVDGKWKSSSEVSKKYGNNSLKSVFSWFCNRFLEKIYQKNYKKVSRR